MIEEPKKKGNGLVIVVIILLLICLGLGGFIYLNKDKIFTKQEQETTKKEDSNTKEGCPEINYDLKTDESNEYGFSDGFGGLFVSVDANRKEVRIFANSNKLSETYGLGWPKTNEESYASSPIDTKTFDKKITQLMIDGIGQDTGGEAILYLMEDGTVEYTPIYKELKTNWNQTDNSKKFNSYGKLEGITDVISLISADVPGKPMGGYHSILARKADGTVINLFEAFKKAGIIEFPDD